jgi:hypothetical protein
MFKYFNINPFPSFSSCLPKHHEMSSVLPFNKTAVETYVSQSEKVRQSLLEDRPVNNGQQFTPQYDTDETIDSGSPNPFTNPRMGELDRFEYAKSLGVDAVQAAQLAESDQPSGVSQAEITSSAPVGDGQ